MTATAARYDTQSAVITVAEIIPSPAPNRSATLKDTNGIRYGIYPNRLAQVRAGLVYDIEFSSKLKDNVTYRDIVNIRFKDDPGAAQRAAVAQQNNRAQPARSPSVQAAAAPGAGQQGGGSSPGGGSYYRPTSPRDAERMFVCSTLNAYIQTGRVEPTPDSLINYVNTLRDVWHATFGTDEGNQAA